VIIVLGWYCRPEQGGTMAWYRYLVHTVHLYTGRGQIGERRMQFNY
jgi:hypothetical protein